MLLLLSILFALQNVNGFRGGLSVNQSDVPWLVFIRSSYQQKIPSLGKGEGNNGKGGFDDVFEPRNVDNHTILQLHGPPCTGVIISEKHVVSSAFCINQVRI